MPAGSLGTCCFLGFFPGRPPAAQRHKRLTRQQKAELGAWRKAHRWHPHQLRHNYATDGRKEDGLESAQVLLGHGKADVTRVYTERDMERAKRVALKNG